MGEHCSLCKCFIFRVFGVFRGLTWRSWVSGSPGGSTREVGSASMPNYIPGDRPLETATNEPDYELAPLWFSKRFFMVHDSKGADPAPAA